MTPFFDLFRGVRQGCPLLPLLYVLYAKVFACAIRANPWIFGLSLPGCSTPLPFISQYADDTALVVTTDDSIVEVFRTYAVFERGSRSKLKVLGVLLVLGMSWRTIGVLGLSAWRTFSNPGERGFRLVGAEP